MNFDWAGFQSYITTIGSILGFFSAVILFYRYSREKPILEFTLGKCVHYQKNTDGDGALSLILSVDNLGERGTTIKELQLLETRPKNYVKHDGEWRNMQDLKYLNPHSSLTIFPMYIIKKDIITENKVDFDILVVYTHGNKKITGISYPRK